MSTYSEKRASHDRMARQRNDYINSALERGIAALEQSGVDNVAKEQLVGARNLFRKSEPIHSEVVERVEMVLSTDRGNWLLTGGEPPYAEIIHEAMILTDMLSNVGDTESALDAKRVGKWGMYLHRLLSVADDIHSYECDKKFGHLDQEGGDHE